MVDNQTSATSAPKKKVRRKRRGNKSRAIREYLSDHPNASPTEVVEALKQRRMRVTPAMVSTTKWKMSQADGSTGNGRRGRKPGRGSSSRISVNALMIAKRAAEQTGGVDELERAISALKKLQ